MLECVQVHKLGPTPLFRSAAHFYARGLFQLEGINNVETTHPHHQRKTLLHFCCPSNRIYFVSNSDYSLGLLSSQKELNLEVKDDEMDKEELLKLCRKVIKYSIKTSMI